MKTINIEAGMPSPQQAMTTLNNRIYAERASGAKCAKIIHGYGSTGKGGTIRTVCRQKLNEYISRGLIKDYCAGEDLGLSAKTGEDLRKNVLKSEGISIGAGKTTVSQSFCLNNHLERLV